MQKKHVNARNAQFSYAQRPQGALTADGEGPNQTTDFHGVMREAMACVRSTHYSPSSRPYITIQGIQLRGSLCPLPTLLGDPSQTCSVGIEELRVPSFSTCWALQRVESQRNTRGHAENVEKVTEKDCVEARGSCRLRPTMEWYNRRGIEDRPGTGNGAAHLACVVLAGGRRDCSCRDTALAYIADIVTVMYSAR